MSKKKWYLNKKKRHFSLQYKKIVLPLHPQMRDMPAEATLSESATKV